MGPNDYPPQQPNPYQPPPPVYPPPPYVPYMPQIQKTWHTAPPIVKGWAYPLSWLMIIFSVFAVLVGPFMADQPIEMRAGIVIFWGAFLALSIWLNRGLKQGTPSAWTVQLVLSIIGLLGFPLGTLIHGYILFNWSKPETKWWFGVR